MPQQFSESYVLYVSEFWRRNVDFKQRKDLCKLSFSCSGKGLSTLAQVGTCLSFFVTFLLSLLYTDNPLTDGDDEPSFVGSSCPRDTMSAGPLFVDDGYVPRARRVVVVLFLKNAASIPVLSLTSPKFFVVAGSD